MNFDLYLDYITSIIRNHVSQIVYLHLSERRAPHAVNWFLSEVPLKTLTWPTLKAVTIEDVPPDALETLLKDSPILSNVHLLSMDVGHDRYHYSEYDECFDLTLPAIILPNWINIVLPWIFITIYTHSQSLNVQESYLSSF
jgi:hypothetical protein